MVVDMSMKLGYTGVECAGKDGLSITGVIGG